MRNTNCIKFLIISLIVSAFIFSCESEAITNDGNAVEEKSFTKSKALIDFENNAPDGILYSDYIVSRDVPSSRRMCSSNPGYNNLVLCSDPNTLGDINSITSWNILDNGPGYIDYELEQLFNFNCQFSYICIRPGGPALETVTAELEFQENGNFNFQTGEYDVYEYLGGAISTVAANEIKVHFACAIKEYRDDNYPNYVIHDLNFFGDALLCGSGSKHFLRVNFKLSRHF